MPLEIERKFLLRNDSWRNQVSRSQRMRQGYLISDELNSVRVRISGEQAELNIKSATVGASRSEFEYPIPLGDAETMLATLCRGLLVEKTRYWIRHGAHEWEIDVFEGDNAGLVVAELELQVEDEAYQKPDWAGIEVTHDTRYYNSYLANNPYKNWR